ncbi:MAG: aldo/keto reductase [Deltaproteobacteria bacterium]|nr:aldo/keto reductase [Deltaproteobacteria bacterium]
MEKRLFGKTGLSVSILGFGCMRLPLRDPDDPSSIDVDIATGMVRQCIDRGVNYVDTAWPYHSKSREIPGESEPFVAHALKDGYREKVFLATKLPTWAVGSRKDMNAFLDAQLKRLDTPYIDCYLAHNLTTNVWPKVKDMGLLAFLDEALADGRIKHAGFSFHDNFQVFENIIESYDWSFAQIQYNYLDVNYQAGVRGLKLAAGKGLGVVVMEPLRGGTLINHVPEELRAMLTEVRPGWSLADWGLRWLWNQPEVSVVLSGMSAMDHVSENLDIADTAAPLTDKELAALDTMRERYLALLKIDCTGCGYCLPCPAGVNIPKNFGYYNDYFLVDSEQNRQRMRFSYAGQVGPHEDHTNCVHCRECEEKCPQHLPISDAMAAMGDVFPR